jgi:hypothetical protein
VLSNGTVKAREVGARKSKIMASSESIPTTASKGWRLNDKSDETWGAMSRVEFMGD